MQHLITYKVISQVFLLSASPFGAGVQAGTSQIFSCGGAYLAQTPDAALQSTVCLQCGSMASSASLTPALFNLTGISPDKCCCSCYPVFTSAFQRTHTPQSGSGGPLSGFPEQHRSLHQRDLQIPLCAVCLYGSPL